jgi:hypothetical protein
LLLVILIWVMIICGPTAADLAGLVFKFSHRPTPKSIRNNVMRHLYHDDT